MKNSLLAFIIFVFLNSCAAIKAYKYKDFDLKDLEKMDAVELASSPQPFHFAYDTAGKDNLKAYLDSSLHNSLSYAFLVIRNDTILYERYFGNINESTRLPSFSVAKSFVSALIGIAIQEKYIKSVQEPITHYIPELRKNDKGFDRVTIQHVLDMRSGVKSNENYYSPFSDLIMMGFSSNVTRPAMDLKLETTPGSFDYKSVNTQLLAIVLERATGRKLQDYAAEKIWTPVGMEYDASWNSDKRGTVRAFCCINAAARDYAKFGRLYLNRGNWQGKQIVPEAWVNSSTDKDSLYANGGYKNQWWANNNFRNFEDSLLAVSFASTQKGAQLRSYALQNGLKRIYRVVYAGDAFHAQGILGQFVYVHPGKKLIIVRLGHNWSHPSKSAEGFIYQLGNAL